MSMNDGTPESLKKLTDREATLHKAQEELWHYKKAFELLVFGGLVKQEKVDQALDIAKTFFKK